MQPWLFDKKGALPMTLRQRLQELTKLGADRHNFPYITIIFKGGDTKVYEKITSLTDDEAVLWGYDFKNLCYKTAYIPLESIAGVEVN